MAETSGMTTRATTACAFSPVNSTSSALASGSSPTATPAASVSMGPRAERSARQLGRHERKQVEEVHIRS